MLCFGITEHITLTNKVHENQYMQFNQSMYVFFVPVTYTIVLFVAIKQNSHVLLIKVEVKLHTRTPV